MSQNIQLQQVVVNGVVIEMGGNSLRSHIVRRVLHRGKGIDLLPMGQHDNASRMLSGRSPDADAACDNPVDLAAPLALSPLLIVFFHISKGRLICQSTDGSGPEGLPLAENDLRVVVGPALILS